LGISRLIVVAVVATIFAGAVVTADNPDNHYI
jgi:hypothetical protein